DDVDAGPQHPIAGVRFVAGRADRGHDLRASRHRGLISSAAELLLIRHGLPVRREVSDGPADPELAAQGHAQAEHMANYLSTEGITAVYTSPLRRACETAAPLARVLGLE